MDDQQRARELLAAEYERDGITHVPDCIRREAMLTTMEDRAIRAITAALRAAPEVTDEMVEAAHAAYWAHPDDSGEDRPCIRAALEAAIAARPQEASDA